MKKVRDDLKVDVQPIEGVSPYPSPNEKREKHTSEKKK